MAINCSDVERYYVGMGEMKVAHNPCLLIITGLGSCIGLALHDRYAKVGGMAHIMLPDSKGVTVEGCCKYADTAVPSLLKEMSQDNARKDRIVAKVAGGASIFSAMDTMRIGEKNATAVKEALKREGIKLVAEDTGGNYARTVTLDTCTGELIVKTKDWIRSI
ncbi:MAG: chemotaxis protein CheD [Candidatus Methanospirareceae archaeon]